MTHVHQRENEMKQISKGANATVTTGALTVKVRAPGDLSAYLLDANGKVRGDEDMVFFNQVESPDGGVRLVDGGFQVDLSKVPAAVDRIALCAVPEGTTLAQAGSVSVEIPGELSFEEATSTMTEAAVIIGEFYRRNGEWKFRAVVQGFNGGLAPLSRHFGIDVADDAPAATTAAPAPAPTSKVDLRKQRIVSLEKSDPKLVSLAKTAAVSLEKKSLAGATAKVVLVLDISASMGGRYRSGEVDRLVQRVLGMGLNMDDDGSIEVYAFGSGAYRIGIADADNYKTFVPDMLRKRSLEGSTHYGATIKMIREDFGSQSDFGQVPVYVLFVTDGDTNDKALTERQIRDASAEGIFWQFVGIGGSGIFSSGFDFLEKLDDLRGRKVDNCDFFSVPSADHPTDVELYDKMMGEYPGWLKAAKKAGVLR
jgi:stress response protein SCP2